MVQGTKVFPALVWNFLHFSLLILHLLNAFELSYLSLGLQSSQWQQKPPSKKEHFFLHLPFSTTKHFFPLPGCIICSSLDTVRFWNGEFGVVSPGWSKAAGALPASWNAPGAIGAHLVKTWRFLPSQPFQGQHNFESCCLYESINI